MCKKLFCLVSNQVIRESDLFEGGNFNEARGGCQITVETLLRKVPTDSINTVKGKFKIVELNVNEHKTIPDENFVAIKKNSNAIILKISNWN